MYNSSGLVCMVVSDKKTKEEVDFVGHWRIDRREGGGSPAVEPLTEKVLCVSTKLSSSYVLLAENK